MKKRYQCIMLLCVVSVFFFSSIKNVMGDQVIIDNGDSISGTVEKIVGGKLTLKTDYSGPIDIDVSKIKKISTSAPVEVHLQSGEVLKGQLKATEDDKIVVESSDGRESTTIDWKKVASINPPPYKWTGSITAGANDQTGNTHRYGSSPISIKNSLTRLLTFSTSMAQAPPLHAYYPFPEKAGIFL